MLKKANSTTWYTAIHYFSNHQVSSSARNSLMLSHSLSQEKRIINNLSLCFAQCDVPLSEIARGHISHHCQHEAVIGRLSMDWGGEAVGTAPLVAYSSPCKGHRVPRPLCIRRLGAFKLPIYDPWRHTLVLRNDCGWEAVHAILPFQSRQDYR